jgi:small conductance mechanosensitive channel
VIHIFPLLSRDEIVAVALATVPRIAAAAAVLALFWGIFKATRTGLRALLHRAGFAPQLIKLLVDNLYKAIVATVAIVMAASQLGINVAAAVTGLGVAGIAVGFAAQETIANMIAGFLIFWDRPFKVGDFITTQSEYGEVRDITMRTTRIRTMENTYVVIPNKQVIGDMLVNHSMYGETRVNAPLSIAYQEDIGAARRTLLAAARHVPGVLEQPAPEVVVTELAGSSVNLQLRVWISNAGDERAVLFRTIEAAKVSLDQAHIEIPFPHLQLFVEDVRDRIWAKAAGLPGLARRAT